LDEPLHVQSEPVELLRSLTSSLLAEDWRALVESVILRLKVSVFLVDLARLLVLKRCQTSGGRLPIGGIRRTPGVD
jgi:hypothetical protein